METIIAILLYLQIMNAPGAYFKTEIDRMSYKNRVEIQNIKADAPKMQMIHDVYDKDVCKITIIDDSRTGSIEQSENPKPNKPVKPETKQPDSSQEQDLVSGS